MITIDQVGPVGAASLRFLQAGAQAILVHILGKQFHVEGLG
jgi:hypothetical protein